MRLESIHIDGFGIFSGLSVQGLPPGLILIQGDNEAGKSTLLAFIRAILFGFPDGRTKENSYPPLAGGAHGGRLALIRENGERLILERKPGRFGGHATITYPDKTQGSEDTLRQLLGGTNKELFKNIYAFSLGELQVFETLQGEAVKNAIYGASLGTAMLAVPKLQSQLERRMSELFKPAGNSPVINRLLSELDDVRSKFRDASKGINAFNDASAELRRIDGQLKEMQGESVGLAANQRRIELYISLWPDWVEIQGFEGELAGLPAAADHFPENGTVRLERELETLDEKKKALQSIAEELANAESEASAAAVNEKLLGQAENIGVLLEKKGRYGAALEALPSANQKLAELRREITRLLDSLGKDWTEDRVRLVDRSLFTREKILSYQERIGACRSRREKAESLLTARKAEMEAAAGEEEAARKLLARFGDAEETVDLSVVQALQTGRDQYASLLSEIPQAQKELAGAKAQLERAVAAIDPNWSIADVEAFDTSVSAQERVQFFEWRLNLGQKNLEASENGLHMASGSAGEAIKRLSALDEELSRFSGASTLTKQDLLARKGSVRSLRSLMSQKAALFDEIRHQQERLADKEQEAKRLERAIAAGPPKILPILGILLAAMGIAAAAAVQMSVGLVLVAAGAILFAVYAYSGSKAASAKREGESLWSGIQGQLSTIRLRLTEMEAEMEGHDASIGKLALALGISPSPVPADIDRLEAELDEFLAAFDRRNRLAEDREKLFNEAARLQEAVADAQKKVRENAAALEKSKKEWGEFLRGLKLKEDMSPATVNLIFNKADSAREQIRSVRTAEERIKALVNSRNAYCELASKIPSLSGAAGKPVELLTEVDVFFERVRNWQKNSQERELAARSLAEKTKRRVDLATAINEAQEQYDGAIQSEVGEVLSWRNFLAEIGLNQELSPSVALDALRIVESCVIMLDQRDQALLSAETCKTEIDDYIRLASEVFSALELDIPEADALPVLVGQLGIELEQSKTNCAAREQVQKNMAKLSDQKASLCEVILECEARVAALLQEAGAENPEEFKTKAAAFRARRELLEKIGQSERNLMRLSGEIDLGSLREKLAGTSLEKLQAEQLRNSVRISEISAQTDELRQRRSDLSFAVANMAGTDDISRLRAEEERILEEIRLASVEWGKNAIASYLLQEARKRFEREQQPKVIRDAGRFFDTISGGRYRNIIAPVGENSVEVVLADGRRRKTDELSRGTAEQLYLAIRFGYIANHSVGQEALPIVMDDILVNFDTERAGRAAKTICNLAHTHQILFFSCHPETVDIFRLQDPEVPLYHLRNGALTEGGAIHQGRPAVAVEIAQ